MFRLTRYVSEILRPTPVRRHKPPGPVVIWNLTRRCNLTCKHCYAFSADHPYRGELSTNDVFDVLDDLHAFGVPALVLSGGEPLLRADMLEIAAHAKSLGLHLALSTNGTLIDDALAERLAVTGFDYVGISIDGRPSTHDRFRRCAGAFDASLRAMRLCRDAGIRVGIRFTLTQDSAADLPYVLATLERERIDRFYLSHLNYAGRGSQHRGRDAIVETTRTAMDRLFEHALVHARRGSALELVTGNNDADGVYFLQWALRRFPESGAHLRAHLAAWGGNSSGVNIANIDNLGDVHPDTYWWDHSLGNVRERPFSRIWRDESDPLLAGLRATPRRIGGRCGACAYFDVCAGNTRTRARRLTGDPWAEDPGCYLSDEELGVVALER